MRCFCWLCSISTRRDSGTTLASTQFNAWFDFVRMEIQPDFPRGETHPHGSLAHFTTQDIATDQRRTRSAGKTRPVCPHCNIVFGRIQEYKRHIRDKHTDRRRCPFCDFQWSRPNMIKVHLISKHAGSFTAEILEVFKGLRGRHVIEFVDAYDY